MKKGFTLIELLAVIVILAIIATIATPIVLDIINDARESSTKRSVEMYAKAVEQSIAKTKIKESVKYGVYKPSNNGKLLIGKTNLEIEYDGDVSCDTYLYKDGRISLYNCIVNGQKIEYSYGPKQEIKKYANGQIVYYDVLKGEGCSESEYKKSNSAADYKGEEGASCLKFYAFNDEGDITVNLLLDHDTTTSVAWNSSGLSVDGPKEILEQLQKDTSSWKNTEIPKNYDAPEGYYSVDYTNYKARLIEAEEVAKIRGPENWDIASNWYYFNDLSQNDETGKGLACVENGCEYGWLYDRTLSYCTMFGCFNDSTYKIALDRNGYWTISARHQTKDDYSAWIVQFVGRHTGLLVSKANSAGVRPVITVLKSNLK